MPYSIKSWEQERPRCLWQPALLRYTSAFCGNMGFSKGFRLPAYASCLKLRWEVMEASVYPRDREHLLLCLHSARYQRAMEMGQVSKCWRSIDSNTNNCLEHTEFSALQQPNDIDGKQNGEPVLNFCDLIIFVYCMYLYSAYSLNKLKLELCGTRNALHN